MAKTSMQLIVTLYIHFLFHSVIFRLGQGFRKEKSWHRLSVIIHKHNGNFIDMKYNIQRLFEIKRCTSASSIC